MQDNIPSVGFDAGEPAKTPYVKIALLAVFGVIATIVLLSMLWKPKYYASLMGAKDAEFVASNADFTRVAATTDAETTISPPPTSPSPYPTVSVYISPPVVPSVSPPKPSTTQAPLQLSFMRILYKDGQPQMTGQGQSLVKYECGDLTGNSVAGRVSLNVQSPVRVTTSNSVWLYGCNYEEMLPAAPAGYMWLKSYMLENHGMNAKDVTFVNRLVKVWAPTSTPTKIPTKTPTKAPSMSPTRVPSPSPTKLPSVSPTLSTSCLPFSCDMTGDGIKNGADLTFFTDCLDAGPVASGECKKADVSSLETGRCDGMVDTYDDFYYTKNCWTNATE